MAFPIGLGDVGMKAPGDPQWALRHGDPTPQHAVEIAEPRLTGQPGQGFVPSGQIRPPVPGAKHQHTAIGDDHNAVDPGVEEDRQQRDEVLRECLREEDLPDLLTGLQERL